MNAVAAAAGGWVDEIAGTVGDVQVGWRVKGRGTFLSEIVAHGHETAIWAG